MPHAPLSPFLCRLLRPSHQACLTELFLASWCRCPRPQALGCTWCQSTLQACQQVRDEGSTVVCLTLEWLLQRWSMSCLGWLACAAVALNVLIVITSSSHKHGHLDLCANMTECSCCCPVLLLLRHLLLLSRHCDDAAGPAAAWCCCHHAPGAWRTGGASPGWATPLCHGAHGCSG